MLAAPACGSSGDAASFTPTTPVADACSMLALSDVQTLLPGAPAGSPVANHDEADFWARGCAWQAKGMSVTLIVQGALNSKADFLLDEEVKATSSATTQATAVANVGDKAVYLVNVGLGQILNARKGSHVVSVGANWFTPAVPEASLESLAVEALGKL